MHIYIPTSSNFNLGETSQERQKRKHLFIQTKIVITPFDFTKSHRHLYEKSDEKIVLWSVFNILNTRGILNLKELTRIETLI